MKLMQQKTFKNKNMFIDKKTKLYVTVNGTLITVDKKFPILFQYMKDNWNDVANEYKELNKDSKYVGKMVKIYLTDESFSILQKELKYYKCNYFKVGLSSTEGIIKLCNSAQKTTDENMAKIPKISPESWPIMASVFQTI